jgi:CLIP-associating protein 1/2
MANIGSGAADEELFMNEFEDVPRVMIFSSKDLEREITKIRETCSDPSIHWEKRVEALKRLRSLLVAGAADFDEFHGFLKPMELSFQVSVKDLRSKVVREACITIAYLSQRLGLRFSLNSYFK